MDLSTDPRRDMLRHAVATLAYRAGNTLRDAPPETATIRLYEGMRSPVEILAHMGDLLDWALSIAAGRQTWRSAEPLAWEAEMERFFTALDRFDTYLASTEPLGGAPERLLQGPVADALTHLGQISLLRRAADAPTRFENYFEATIGAGAMSAKRMTEQTAEQAPARAETE